MIYTITLNPALDYIIKLKELVPNEINTSESEYILPGGKGINVSIILKRLDVESVTLGFISGFTGKEIQRLVEKEEILSKIKDKPKIMRSKGLGENDPEMMSKTTMNPETRRLIRIMPEDEEKTKMMFDLLLGDNLQGRKDHIAVNGYKFVDPTDLN